MEPDRFDDVAFRIVEGPGDEPPRPRRPRRLGRLLAAAASALAVGALLAGSSALADSGSASAAKKPGTWSAYPLRGHLGHHGAYCTHPDGSGARF